MADRFISYVLAQRPFDVPCDTLVRTMNTRFRDAGVATEVGSNGLKDRSGYILSVGGVAVVVIYAAFQVPAETFTGSATVARDQAAQRSLINHGTHAIVAVLGEHVGHQANLRAATAAMRVGSALSELNDATAIFWTDSSTLMEAAMFRNYVKKIAQRPEHVPMEILIRAAPYQVPAPLPVQVPAEWEPPRVAILGVGFRPFIGRDIEFVPKPIAFNIMANRFSGIGRWLLMQGLVFADGESCGVSPHDVIRVRYLDKGRELAGPVLSFDIERLDPSF